MSCLSRSSTNSLPFLFCAVSICLSTCLSLSIPSAQAQSADEDELIEAAFKQATALADPSIVRIETVGGLDRVGKILTGTAPTTGVVVGEDGFIISSSFNFISKPASILVQLADGRRFPARLVSSDHVRMVTLLKIDADSLKPLRAAPPEDIRVGQWSLALGRTYDLQTPSISVGIVSALNRIWGKAVQTDAKVSPVNYGGPLIDIRGRAQGILVPLSPSASGETAGIEWYDSGIGFAIPLHDIYKNLERMKTGEDLKPGLIGVTLKSNNPYTTEVILDRVRYGSPAEKAGLKSGDRIVRIAGEDVARQTQIQTVLGSRYAGETISIAVRRDDKKIDAELKLVSDLPPWEAGFLGILPRRFATDSKDAPQGVEIRMVYPESPAEIAGLKAGDVITGCSEKAVRDSQQLLDLVSRIRPEQTTTIEYSRAKKSQTVDVKLAAVLETIPDVKATLIPPADVDFDAVTNKASKEKTEDSGEKPGESSDEKNDNKKTEPAKAAAVAKAKTGRLNESLPDGSREFWAYVPQDYNPAWEYGLMVWLHPGGDTMEAKILKEWKSICERRGIILLAPKSRQPNGWSADEGQSVVECVKWIQERYSVDPSRVYLHGYQDGGSFAWYLGFKHREIFRGVQAIAAGLRQRPPENRPDFRQQFHLICGERDRVFPLVRATYNGLKRLKFPATLSAAAGQERKYPTTDQIEEAGRWADSLDRI